MQRIRQAVILAGGKGTRLRPTTYTIPKPLIKVNGVPLIDYNLKHLSFYGIEEIYLCIGYLSDKIVEYVGDGSRYGLEVNYVVEDKPMGTGGPLPRCNGLDDVFIMMNSDEITNLNFQKMEDEFLKSSAEAMLFLTEVDDPKNLGLVDFEGKRIKKFREKGDFEPGKRYFVSAGRYMMKKSVVEIIKSLNKENISMEREIFPMLADNEELYAYLENAFWKTVNSHEQLRETERALTRISFPWISEYSMQQAEE